MDAIEKIRAKLAGYAGVQYLEEPDKIEVRPADETGFAVGLVVAPAGFTVYFDGWHEEFASEKEALECFAFGLSSACRLAVVFRGDRPAKWTVESLNDGQWTPDSTTGLLLQPFWRSSRVVYRRNRLLDAD